MLGDNSAGLPQGSPAGRLTAASRQDRKGEHPSLHSPQPPTCRSCGLAARCQEACSSKLSMRWRSRVSRSNSRSLSLPSRYTCRQAGRQVAATTACAAGAHQLGRAWQRAAGIAVATPGVQLLGLRLGSRQQVSAVRPPTSMAANEISRSRTPRSWPRANTRWAQKAATAAAAAAQPRHAQEAACKRPVASQRLGGLAMLC
jgi:hypothetical protein